MSKEQSKALFYTQGEEEVLKSLDTSIDGLSTAQANDWMPMAITSWMKVKNAASCQNSSISLKI